MSDHEPIQRIAIVGTGVIGASWAAQYLARGLDVVATDPAPRAEDALRKYIDAAWPLLTKVGLSPGASRERLTFESDARKAVASVDLVQENAPERADFKIKLFAQMDEAAPPRTILASSSSALTMTVIQSGCKRPERCVIGHPFNPPHVVPLVEVVGGDKTSPETIERAMEFYAAVNKKPILLHKPMPGHVANRLQAALYREMLYLIAQGVVSVEDADIAVCYGPGLRWGVMGQSLQWHLGGGAGGIHHFMEHLMDPMIALMKTFGMPEVDAALKQRIVDGVLSQAGGRSVEDLANEENEIMSGALRLRGFGLEHSKATTRGRVFFLDVSGGRIESINPDGSDRRLVVEGLKRIPDGIQVDVEAKYIYWTNMGNPVANDGSIQRADLDGGNLTTLVPQGGTFTPKQLKLDRLNGKLYWCDREGMRVMRANLDGSNVETLVETGRGEEDRKDQTKWCVGIAVDAGQGHVYWTQKGPDKGGKGRLFRAGLDLPAGETPTTRSDIEVLYDCLPEPIDLDLDLEKRIIYWSDRGEGPRGNSINCAPMDSGPTGRPAPRMLLNGLNEAIGLSLDLTGQRMFFTDLSGSVYSASLDGSKKKALLVAQGNLTGTTYVELPA